MVKEFKGLKSIGNNHSNHKFTLGIMGAIIVIFALLFAFEKSKNADSKEMIYVMSGDGTVQSALKKELGMKEIIAEAKNHLYLFLMLMNQNDQGSFPENTKWALDLAGDVGIHMLNEKAAANELDNMKKYNIRTTISLSFDDITVNNDGSGEVTYRRNFYADNAKPISYEIRSVFQIIQTGSQRTERNPHAMLITEFKTIQQNELKQ